ncbi:MAG: ArsC family reductase [Ewingella americana]|jgi:Spx/MgsR family transcriptional regulator|uniref:Glutathione-dependent thiol reductase n=2 Tax=Ewingella americana TaxID=41202 RepID=A0A085G8J2_EWIA3|nr:ArsC family reductase [Ewingella americana]KAA8726013.1 ArsC family reductase [Ewingella americana]KFC80037.1 glutathione-dependent thiol reductase [Ewingella americana ATCC 33852]MCI1677531.1 ArsC family reductase [Ewingella americana]MCI1852780.1 ArsC family reductase [Ewingella americana]MCI1861134.1 ArsC family reductase [Ewingella americana]
MAETSSKTPFILYGIKNCDTVKKARRWLEDNGSDYRFHDYRVDGLDADLLQQLIDKQSWEALLNTKGTTWRKLDEATRAACDNQEAAKALMLEHPAMIKRPFLLAASGESLLGFKPESYQQFIEQVK